MSAKSTVGQILERITKRSPSGFAIGLHITFSTPKYLFQSYDRKWIEIYSKRGLILRDPTVRWGFGNTGTIRWSTLAEQDEEGVLKLAAEHGLKYGVTVGLDCDNSRTIASFARPDREFTDAEIDDSFNDLIELHKATQGTESLSPEVHEVLKRMSVILTHG